TDWRGIRAVILFAIGRRTGRTASSTFQCLALLPACFAISSPAASVRSTSAFRTATKRWLSSPSDYFSSQPTHHGNSVKLRLWPKIFQKHNTFFIKHRRITYHTRSYAPTQCRDFSPNRQLLQFSVRSALSRPQPAVSPADLCRSFSRL